MKYILTFSILLLAQLASANSVVICGKTANFEDFSVTDFKLMVSSEYDKYKGTVGKNWNLKLGSEDDEWEKPNKNIVAKTVKRNGASNVEIEVIFAFTPSGPVGERYLIKDIFSEDPVLETYNIGGFTGNIKTGTYKCVSAVD